MKCPACTQPLTRSDLGGVQVDVCADGCHGLWLDGAALALLAEGQAGSGEAFQRELLRETEAERKGPADCPAGHGQLEACPHPDAEEVTIDVCRTCGGVFLDPGELAAIRRHVDPARLPTDGGTSTEATLVLERVYKFLAGLSNLFP